MSITAIYAAKGGQGTSTIAAALAIIHARNNQRTLLVDTGHDIAAILNTRHLVAAAHPVSPVNVTANLDVLVDTTAATPLRAYISSTSRPRYDVVIIDAANPDALHDTDHRILVTRPCYLALARAMHHPVRPTGVVVINEPGRALDLEDIEAVLGIAVTARVPFDSSSARAIDAGLLTTALPGALARSLRPLVRATEPAGAAELGEAR